MEVVYPLNRDPLDLIERNFIPGSVVELGGARAFVRANIPLLVPSRDFIALKL